MRKALWTREDGSIRTIACKGNPFHAPSLTPDEAKQFAKGIRKARKERESKPGEHRDKSRRAVRQSGGYVTSGWQAKVGGTIRLSKALLNADTEAKRRDR
jgi:hypothetical protein